MSREERVELITKIEEAHGRRLLCYVTGDRNPAPAQIGDDALRPIFDQLKLMGDTPKLV